MENQFLSTVPKGGIGTKAGGAHENKYFQFVVGSFTADGNLLQPMVCVNSTPHTSPFARSQRARMMMCDTTLALVLVRVIPSMCHVPE